MCTIRRCTISRGAVLVGRAPPQRLPHGDVPRRAAVRVIPSGPTVDAGWRSVHDVLVDAQPLPQALVCYNDQYAQGALIALWRARPSAPGDNQGGGFRQHAHRVLEGVRADPGRPGSPGRSREVARLALDLANARARGDRSAPRRLEVDTRVVRRSTA